MTIAESTLVYSKTHPGYSASALRWLEGLPAHWKVTRLKYVSKGSGLYGANEPASRYSTHGVRFVRTSDIDDGGQLTPIGVYLEKDLVREYILESRDLLLSRSGTIGRSFLYDPDVHAECAYAGYLVRFRLKEDVSPRFVFYFTKSQAFADWTSTSVVESTIGNVNAEKYASMPLPCPPIAEQKRIAALLDRETTKIDALMAKNERLIELLEEKRAAMIARAVTQGPNDQTPVKDSTGEWVGKIPSHWQVKRLKFAVPQVTVGIVVTPAKFYVDNGVPCLRSLNVTEGALIDSDLVFISPKSNQIHSKSIVRAGDVVVVRTGQPGTAAVIDAQFDGANCIDLIIVRQGGELDSRFLTYAANSFVAKAQFESGSEGAIQQHFNVETAKNLILPLPPLEEQQSIADSLDRDTSAVERLISKVREAADRLKEYRTALISAAVTGKIDVREDRNATG